MLCLELEFKTKIRRCLIFDVIQWRPPFLSCRSSLPLTPHCSAVYLHWKQTFSTRSCCISGLHTGLSCILVPLGPVLGESLAFLHIHVSKLVPELCCFALCCSAGCSKITLNSFLFWLQQCQVFVEHLSVCSDY